MNKFLETIVQWIIFELTFFIPIALMFYYEWKIYSEMSNTSLFQWKNSREMGFPGEFESRNRPRVFFSMSLSAGTPWLTVDGNRNVRFVVPTCYRKRERRINSKSRTDGVIKQARQAARIGAHNIVIRSTPAWLRAAGSEEITNESKCTSRATNDRNLLWSRSGFSVASRRDLNTDPDLH